MAVDPKYLKNSRLDKLYEIKYNTYEELRADLAAINTSLLNEEGNIVFDNVHDSYSTAARHSVSSKNKRKKYSKKRVYGIVVGNSKEIGKNVYVDVPIHSMNFVQDDSILLLKEEINPEEYQELIFFPNINSLQMVPQLGTICAVLIPDNYPNHIISNPEDAIFLEVYRKQVVSPANFSRPEPLVVPGSQRDRILKLMSGIGSGGGGGGEGGGETFDSSGIPDSGEYNESVRQAVINALPKRPEDENLKKLTGSEIKTYSRKKIKEVSNNGWIIVNPQDPAKTPSGKRTMASKNHDGITKLYLYNVPVEYCTTSDMYLYDEAIYSFIAMKAAVLKYLDENLTPKGISYNKREILQIYEAYRTWPDQAYLINKYRLRGGVASQGRSNHQGGLAVDMKGAKTQIRGKRLDVLPAGGLKATPEGIVFEWLRKNAWHFGWRRTVSTEIWHWEFRKAWIGKEYIKGYNNEVDNDLQQVNNITGEVIFG